LLYFFIFTSFFFLLISLLELNQQFHPQGNIVATNKR